MYTQSTHNLTELFTEIQIDRPFKYIFMKIYNGTEPADIDFSKSKLTMRDVTFSLEKYNLVDAYHRLDRIYDGLLYSSFYTSEPTTVKFNLVTNDQVPYQLYVVTMEEHHNNILYKERESGIRNIGSLSWMCSDTYYLELENRARVLYDILENGGCKTPLSAIVRMLSCTQN